MWSCAWPLKMGNTKFILKYVFVIQNDHNGCNIYQGFPFLQACATAMHFLFKVLVIKVFPPRPMKLHCTLLSLQSKVPK